MQLGLTYFYMFCNFISSVKQYFYNTKRKKNNIAARK